MHRQVRNSGLISTPGSSCYCFCLRGQMTRQGLWPGACLEKWMPFGSFSKRRELNPLTILVKEPCALAYFGENAVTVPKVIKATVGWRGFYRSNKPAVRDRYLCSPCWWMLSIVISKNESLIYHGSANILLIYP